MSEQKKCPELRFKGDKDEWEQRRFDSTFDFLQNNTLSRAELVENGDGAKNIHYGDILVKFRDCTDISVEALPIITGKDIINKYRASFLKNGDVIIADTAEDETAGKCTEIIGVKGETIISGLHTIPCRPIEPYAEGYLGYYMNSSAFHDQLIPLMQGIKVTSISKKSLQLTALFCPKAIEEQARIGDYFKKLDELIESQEKKVTQFENIKKALLDKMFPQQPCTRPAIRFKGFTEEWEECRLGDVAPLRGGFAFQSQEYCSSGVPIVKISNIHSNGEVGGQFDYYEELENEEEIILPDGAAVLAMSGATTGKIAILTIKDKRKYYQNQRVGYFRQTERIDYAFFTATVRSWVFFNQLNSVLVTGAQPNVSPKEIDSFKIKFPKNTEEQTRIGALFKKLDSLLALHKAKLEKLRQIKQACLQKMFI